MLLWCRLYGGIKWSSIRIYLSKRCHWLCATWIRHGGRCRHGWRWSSRRSGIVHAMLAHVSVLLVIGRILRGRVVVVLTADRSGWVVWLRVWLRRLHVVVDWWWWLLPLGSHLRWIHALCGLGCHGTRILLSTWLLVALIHLLDGRAAGHVGSLTGIADRPRAIDVVHRHLRC